MSPIAYAPIPVTILTSFLGAGKTTLLNRILHGDHGLRVAVLVNDFGEINIDSQLVVAVPEEDVINLANGCICCSIRGDLIEALHKQVNHHSAPEYLVIETSGISNPGEVVQTMMLPQDDLLAYNALREAIDNLPSTVFRAKGVLYLDRIRDRQAILQVVGKRAQIELGSGWHDQSPRSHLVVIGAANSLDVAWLQEHFEACLAKNVSYFLYFFPLPQGHGSL